MPNIKLTDPFIRNFPKPEKRLEYYDTYVSGLIVRITPTGHKSFSYRYRFNNKVKRFTIGSYPKISLADARAEVGNLERKIKDGIDPLAEQKARRNKPEPKNFEYLVEQFKDQHLPRLRPSTQRTYGHRIDSEILPAFKGRLIKNISRRDIMEMLEEIAFERDAPVHSNRVRSILSSMYSFAVQREIAEFNPVKSINRLGEENSRDRVCSITELKKLWEGFGLAREPTCSVFRILLMLGQRKTETCRMAWSDIENGVWKIPDEHTKADRNHYVPLPSMALEIIEDLSNDSAYVFESRINKGEPVKYINDAFARITEELEIEDLWIHDLRRTAATYMAELGTNRTILGKILNHKRLSGDTQVTARYDRYDYMDEKVEALNRWNKKLQQIIYGKHRPNVYRIGEK